MLFDGLRKVVKLPPKPLVPEYGLLYFDQIQADYFIIESKITEQTEKARLSEILDKRKKGLLTWDDIYVFEMIVLRHQDFAMLKGKISSLRNRFSNLVDSAELESFDLKRVSLNAATDSDETHLRAEYTFLVREFCLRYALLSAREKLRSRLLRGGAILTLIFFLFSAGIAVYAVKNESVAIFSFSTLLAVIFSGITGAFVSMQQRIQSSPNNGEPMLNLSLLTHGWLSIFLSPISGAIFAVVLYLFFIGGLLSGKIFPTVVTQTPPTFNVTVDQPAANGNAGNKPNAAISWAQQQPISLAEFLLYTKPVGGTDFALVLIWSFIAGFAERFVPDTLMRLVDQKKSKEDTDK